MTIISISLRSRQQTLTELGTKLIDSSLSSSGSTTLLSQLRQELAKQKRLARI